ncbi:MAG TPA: CinA family protein [Caulobacterales bacterium]|nr:CinA family protein [Caulobacterales bacterium]
MFPDSLNQAARDFLSAAQKQNLRLVTAESCTGGLIAACVCEIPGCSATLERGFVVYSNDAKAEMLGVPMALIEAKGAVSAEVALAMAQGALAHSRADISIAVTGIAGPDGGSAEKPVGLVHFAAARAGREALHEEHRFGDIGRLNVQAESVATAFRLLKRVLA